MKLCMFHPLDHPLERGWVGRVDGERVIQLAAQTLQSFFTGGGTAREHAEYPLAEVRLLAPVLHPPSIRTFDEQSSFTFANPAAVVGPGAQIEAREGGLLVLTRVAAVIGADEAIGGFTVLAEWRAPELQPPKDRDFALGLGPVVATPDELDGASGDFDWTAARQLAASGTVLCAGDVLAAPAHETQTVDAGAGVDLDVDGVGTLRQSVR